MFGGALSAIRKTGSLLKANSLLILLAMTIFAGTAYAVEAAPATSAMPWWGWPLVLFITCFFLGIVAVPSGVGGGVLFVPIVGGFFPFHLDFVRGAGLLVALASLPPGHRCCVSGSPICVWRYRWRYWHRPAR